MLRMIGLMSGTSLDGVDVALLETDGERIGLFGPSGYRPYKDAEREVLRAALDIGPTLQDRHARPDVVHKAERIVTDAHREAVVGFLADHGIPLDTIDAIGFHGQTIFHNPRARLTIQIGDAAHLSTMLGRPVIADFRAADVAAGGQGAPFAPVYHRALAHHAGLNEAVVFINIGGVGNITLIDKAGDMLAFDSGPGNALIDDLMKLRTGEAMDRNGATAARGTIDQARLSTWLAHPFFHAAPPKSLDRNAWAACDVHDLSTEDAAATLTALTAHSIAIALAHGITPPKHAIVVGGGVHNPTLLAMLATAANLNIRRAQDLGFDGDAVEAQAFAFLAARSLRGLPLSFPGTTGVPVPQTGGVRFQP
jgi:anhydro-N-acetylmuramic acid kinase